MMKLTEVAWAAGFIDGEGCFSASINGRGTVRAILSISQRLPEPLNDLQRMFNAGTIAPVMNHGNPAYILTISQKDDLLRVINRVHPYLRCKQDQAETLRGVVEHLIKHGGHGRYSGIDKVWCAEQVALMKAQKRPWIKT